MSTVDWPSVADVAQALRGINANVECLDEEGCDVRLCVWSDGVSAEWVVHYGDVSYDQSHSTYCGAASVPGVVDGVEQDLDAEAIAQDLISQCQDQEGEEC